MQRALLRKCLAEAWILLLACLIGMIGFAWMRTWLVSRLELGAFAKVIEQVWDKYDKFSPVPLSQLISYNGRVALTYAEPIVVICMSVWCVARGSDVVSGEIGRGSMEMLLSLPVSRWRVLVTQSMVTLIGVAVLAAGAWGGVAAGIHTCEITETVQPSFMIPGVPLPIPNPLAEAREIKRPMSDEVDARTFGFPALNLFCLGVCLAGCCTLMSAWDRYRWRTIGLLIAWLVLQLIFRVAAAAAESLHWMNYLTVFWAYEPEVTVELAVHRPEELWALVIENRQGTRLGPLGSNLVLLALGALGFTAAGVVFHRRNLPAPM